jgi:hypothetical protein
VTELSYLLEDRDIHQVYLARYRAEYLADILWQLTNRRVSWQQMPATPREAKGDGGGDGAPSSGSFSASGPRYLDYEVPPVAVLGFKHEARRIWSASHREGLLALTLDERRAWEEHMLRPRYSAVFVVVHKIARVRRSDSVSTSKQLASAALKLSEFSELRTGERT